MSNVTNEQLISTEKAVITTDAIATAGKLLPAQADRFIDYLADYTVMKNNTRVVRFSNESLEIYKLGVGRRVAVAKAEAADPKIRRGVRTSKISITPREVMTPFEISDNFKETNVEGASVEDHIVRLMARQTGNDVEELWLYGDKLGPAVLESEIIDDGTTAGYVKDTFLSLIDGWVTQAWAGHTVDFGGQNIGLDVFARLYRALPFQFKRNPGELRWFMSPDLWSIYAQKLATRGTALGDAAATQLPENAPGPMGIRPVAVPLMPLNPRIVEHVVVTGTTPTQLKSGNIQSGSVAVHATTLLKTPNAGYVENTDYSIDYTTGRITRVGSGITSASTVKVTYRAAPQIILTHRDNMIAAIGRDIRIEKDRDIYKTVNQYAITVKVDATFEETDAIAFGYNIGQGV